MSSSIGIQRIFFYSINHWSRYERSLEVPIWNDFQIILFGVAVRFVYVSPPLSFDTYKEQRTERAKRQKYGRRERKNLDLKREPHEIVQIITKNDT
jgi:hypothetical protein